jgi:pimeloyl-ACP methyl ester carboxylesterase
MVGEWVGLLKILLVGSMGALPMRQLEPLVRTQRRLRERLTKLLPRAEWAELTGVNHSLHEEDPARFNRVALEFLGRVP